MDHKGRLQRLQQGLRQRRFDTLLVNHPPNVRYLCGFTGSAGAMAVSQKGAIFFTDGRYIAQAIEQSRMTKDAEEIDLIRRAVLLGAGLFDTILETIRLGIRESDVAAEMEYAARRAGAEGMSFETIIAAGQRSALPHGRASNKPI